jgi:hypothetical protein
MRKRAPVCQTGEYPIAIVSQFRLGHHMVNGSIEHGAKLIGTDYPYSEGDRTLQVDAIVFNKNTGIVRAYEIKTRLWLTRFWQATFNAARYSLCAGAVEELCQRTRSRCKAGVQPHHLLLRARSIFTLASRTRLDCFFNAIICGNRTKLSLVSDFTYVATWTGFVYVAFVIDAYARRIVGWPRAPRMQASCSMRWSRHCTIGGRSARPLRDYCVGLMMPCERKSVEPMAAVTAPERTAAQHQSQSLLHSSGSMMVPAPSGGF